MRWIGTRVWFHEQGDLSNLNLLGRVCVDGWISLIPSDYAVYTHALPDTIAFFRGAAELRPLRSRYQYLEVSLMRAVESQ